MARSGGQPHWVDGQMQRAARVMDLRIPLVDGEHRDVFGVTLAPHAELLKRAQLAQPN